MALERIQGNMVLGGGGGGGGGSDILQAFSSRASAEGAMIDGTVTLLAVQHSGQLVHYRRYTEGGTAATYAALKTNGGTVNWVPAAEITPLHWGAMGDGVTNDRIALQNMMRFYYGTPATNGSMPAAFASQKPITVTGQNRTYAVAAPLVWGNLGTSVDTGMVYNFRLRDIRLKAIAGDWNVPLIENVPLRYILMAGWNFEADYSDEYSGIYDVLLDHVTFDMDFLTGATWVCNTYQFTMSQCRYQHPGIGQVVCDTSVRTANQGTRPFGYNTGNGAYTLIGPNIEGLVGESGASYPEGRDISTMGTIGIRIYTNDAKIDSWIVSRVTTAADFYGGEMLISNPHPWSSEVRIRPTANNIMVANGYLDYTKFILESFSHMFVGCHWILPPGTGADRGVELRASNANETGEGLLFTGCTFGGESLDIRYTTEGDGTWVGDKNRRVSIIGCKYTSGHTIAQIERFENKHGFTVASGAHWFRTGDITIGECRLVGSHLYIGKDRTVAGLATLQLQGQAGDTPSLILRAFAAGGAGVLNQSTGFLQLGVNARGNAIFVEPSGGRVSIGASFTVDNSLGESTSITAASGDIRAVAGGLATGAKTVVAVTDTTPGFRATGSNCGITTSAGSPTTSAPLNLSRSEAGFLIRGGCGGTVSAGAGISINSSGVFAFVTSSDERLKKDFKPIDPSLIDKFGAYDFEWINSPGVRAMGVKAQELRKVLPGLVHGSGKINKKNPEEDDYFGVDYAQIVPLLISVVKDLRERVRQLETT